jgi:hypothetical protein
VGPILKQVFSSRFCHGILFGHPSDFWTDDQQKCWTSFAVRIGRLQLLFGCESKTSHTRERKLRNLGRELQEKRHHFCGHPMMLDNEDSPTKKNKTENAFIITRQDLSRWQLRRLTARSKSVLCCAVLCCADRQKVAWQNYNKKDKATCRPSRVLAAAFPGKNLDKMSLVSYERDIQCFHLLHSS